MGSLCQGTASHCIGCVTFKKVVCKYFINRYVYFYFRVFYSTTFKISMLRQGFLTQWQSGLAVRNFFSIYHTDCFLYYATHVITPKLIARPVFSWVFSHPKNLLYFVYLLFILPFLYFFSFLFSSFRIWLKYA